MIRISRISKLGGAPTVATLSQRVAQTIAEGNTFMTRLEVITALMQGDTIHTEFSLYKVIEPTGGRDWHGECDAQGCHHCDYRGTV